jgi:hypothetical protein
MKASRILQQCSDPNELPAFCTESPHLDGEATPVYIRVVFMKLGEIDTVKETFTADVFIQAKWREPRLDGKQTAEREVLRLACA